MEIDLPAVLRDVQHHLRDLYGSRLKALIVFGSYARGQATRGSDLDVAMVLDTVERPWLEIQRTSTVVSALSLKYGISLSLIPLRETAYRQRLTPLAQSVAKEGRLVA